MMHIRSPELIHHMTESLYPLADVAPFPCNPSYQLEIASAIAMALEPDWLGLSPGSSTSKQSGLMLFPDISMPRFIYQ